MYRNDYNSFLHLAIKHGPTKAAMALIENGANVDFPYVKVSSISSVKKFAATFFEHLETTVSLVLLPFHHLK